MSDDDELLRRLAEAAREDEAAESARLDGRWDALSAGALSPADEETLRREAETSMETRQAYEAFSPLGAEFRARMVKELRGRLGAEPSQDVRATPARLPSLPARRAPRLERFARLRRGPLRWAGFGAVAGLAAAALMLILRPGVEQTALPEYSLNLRGAVREMRSAEPESPPHSIPVFAPGNLLELVLTPRQPAAGGLEVQILAGRSGDFRPLPVPVETAESGAVRIAGRVGEAIDLQRGETTLLVVIGRAGSLPPARELAVLLGPRDHAQGEHWSAWKVRVSVEGEEHAP